MAWGSDNMHMGQMFISEWQSKGNSVSCILLPRVHVFLAASAVWWQGAYRCRVHSSVESLRRCFSLLVPWGKGGARGRSHPLTHLLRIRTLLSKMERSASVMAAQHHTVACDTDHPPLSPEASGIPLP